MRGWGKPIVLLLLPLFGLMGQPSWDLSIVIQPFPSPYIGDWETDPAILSLNLEYRGTADVRVKIHTEFIHARLGCVARGGSRDFLVSGLPRRQILSGDLIDWTRLEFAEDFAVDIGRSGRFAEGDWQLRLQVREWPSKRLLAQTSARFYIIARTPPRLVLPADDDTIRSPHPVFQWVPAVAPYHWPITYRLIICEVVPGQSRVVALRNPAHFSQTLQNQISYHYPSDALPLEPGHSYVWQVQAVDPEGRPVGENEGRSELWQFTYIPEGESSVVEELEEVLKADCFRIRSKFGELEIDEGMRKVLKGLEEGVETKLGTTRTSFGADVTVYARQSGAQVRFVIRPIGEEGYER